MKIQLQIQIQIQYKYKYKYKHTCRRGPSPAFLPLNQTSNPVLTCSSHLHRGEKLNKCNQCDFSQADKVSIFYTIVEKSQTNAINNDWVTPVFVDLCLYFSLSIMVKLWPITRGHLVQDYPLNSLQKFVTHLWRWYCQFLRISMLRHGAVVQTSTPSRSSMTVKNQIVHCTNAM